MITAIRKPLDGFAAATMVVLCICWGLQQVAVKMAAPDLDPVMQLGLRSLVAAVLVYGVMLWQGHRISPRDRTWWPGILAGALFALEFLAVSVGLTFTSASHMVVFLYIAPIFTALGLHVFVKGEHLHKGQWIGVAVAFAGLALAFSNGLSTRDGDWQRMLIGDVLGVVGGLFWAATTVAVRCTALSEAPPTQTLLYQLGFGALLLIGVGLLSPHPVAFSLTGVAWASLLFQAVIVAFFSFLAWFWMLRRYLASRLSVFSFLTPLFGVAFGVLLLGDALEPRFLAGAALVLVGIVLVNLRR